MNQIRHIAAVFCGLASLLAAQTARPAIQDLAGAVPLPEVNGIAMPSPLRDLFGASGNLRALFGTPEWLSQNPALQPLLSALSLGTPGVHLMGLPANGGKPFAIVTLESLSAIRGAHVDAYRVGTWPTRGHASRDSRYAPPSGFIPVTPENESTLVSKRFFLRDFLTHDQQDVWPKVLVLRVALLDKLELIGDELERRGLPGSLHVMSGFRTPQYNARGVGSKGGRASQSRHMYGDAADVIVDGNRDGRMDDLDGDGKITIHDARVLYAVAEGVEARYPDLVGGLSAYPANAVHGPFVHVDARGIRARW